MRLLAVAIAIAATCASIGQELELVDEVRLEDQSIAKDEAIDLALPALPAREGHVAVLTFRAVIRTEGPGGCNYNASILINGAPVSRYAAGGDERLLGRLAGLDLVEGAAPPFPVFSGDRAMMMFAPDVDTGDAMTLAGLGATFALDVTDLVSGVDGNTVTFRNLLPGVPKPGYGDLRVEAIAVGYVSRDALPQPLSDVPERGRVAQEVTQDDLHLAQSARGGFVIRAQTGHELLVETGLGMSPDTESVLIADDQASVVDGVSVDVAEWGAVGFRMEAAWPELTLERTVEIRDGLIDWRETWRNEGDVIRGVPFRHRVFLRQPVRRAHIGGSSDRLAVSGSAPNPTIFLEAPDGTGDGFGVTAESDWLRLLMGLRVRGGVGEILSETLALAPGKSVDFRLSIEPVTDGGGYWSFINGLRDRWGVNGITNERPMFWGYARAENDDPDERVAESLAHLGPITVVLGPWQRLEPDAKTVRAGRAPKLPEGAPRTAGGDPDLDVEAFLTYEHRERYWTQLGIDIDRIRRAAPNVRVMQMIHPAMEAVYKPAQDRWPILHEAIRTADGGVFQAAHYSQAWLGDLTEKDWGVLYYSPRPGSVYLDQIMSGVRRGLDQYGLDGIYCDEFSWAGTGRGYSRYDYGHWDGYSADLDETGAVVRLKSDNGTVTESFQLQLVNEVMGRGLFFLGNGGNALRSLNALPHARFIEGGNGAAHWVQGHLHPTPLVLGNMGDEKSLTGAFDSVRKLLAQGCIYSPVAVNLLLGGPDSFVCKLYPITVREIGPGWVVGGERIITTVSRSFDWTGEARDVRVLRYSSEGDLLEVGEPIRVDGEFVADVPEGGLLIAERA